MNDDIAARLLAAIETNRLVLMLGAGLSMAPPSSLPSAAAVAEHCAAEYQRRIGPLPEGLARDIEGLARHFHARGEFEALFLGRLVPWSDFARSPNKGHAAVADFLACSLPSATVTTNFDALVEAAARCLGEPDFRATVEGIDIGHVTPHGSYLKLHGCGDRSRWQTIWCREQLTEDSIRDRLDAFVTWLAPRLRDHDLLFVGFWSDWQYLEDVLHRTLSAGRPRHVLLVDPAESEILAEKAPRLWAWASGGPGTFEHVRESGAEFLDALRCRWSQKLLDRMDHEALATYRGLFNREPAAGTIDHASLDTAALYALRRDLTGTCCSAPARDREPQSGDRIAAALHRRLCELGSRYEGQAHTFGDRRVRVISGRGRVLSDVRAQFMSEPPTYAPAEHVVCAGAWDDAAPAHIVRGDQEPTIVRPGISAHWETHEALLAELSTSNA